MNTPRTDAEFSDDYYTSGFVRTEFAQQLERELAAAIAQRDKAREEAEHYKLYARSLYLAAQPFCNIKADDGDTFNGYAPETIIRFEATVNELRRLRICASAGLPADGVAIDSAMKECGK